MTSDLTILFVMPLLIVFLGALFLYWNNKA